MAFKEEIPEIEMGEVITFMDDQEARICRTWIYIL